MAMATTGELYRNALNEIIDVAKRSTCLKIVTSGRKGGLVLKDGKYIFANLLERETIPIGDIWSVVDALHLGDDYVRLVEVDPKYQTATLFFYTKPPKKSTS